MCLRVAGLWHGAIFKSCPFCVPTLNLSLSLAASQTPKSIPPGKESPPLTSAQALRARVTTILPGQRAAGCEWRGPHQPKRLAETQGCGERDGEGGCPSKAMSDLGWGGCPGAGQGTLPLRDQTWDGAGVPGQGRAGHTPSRGSDLGTNSLCYSSVAR